MENSKTTDEAMDLLGNFKGYYAALARFIAVQIAMMKSPWYDFVKDDPALKLGAGEVHSYAVRLALERSGRMEGYEGKYHFLGLTFRDRVFESAGKSFSYSHTGEERSVHQRTVTVWKIKPGSGAGSIMEPMMPADVATKIERAKNRESEVLALREKALAEKHGGRR